MPYKPVSPSHYPLENGFPYHNLARWYDVSYAKILNNDQSLPEFILQEIREIKIRETRRSHGYYGSMPYGV